jgi:Cytochrome c3
MRRLILLGLALLAVAPLAAQQRTRSPHGDLKLECKTCHAANGWTPVRISTAFDHSKFGFKLQGAHGTATCRACHKALDFKGVKSDCVGCHADVHQGELGTTCDRCHTARSFIDRAMMTKSHQLTRFPLVGAHLATDCAGCHKPGAQGQLQFVSTTSSCVSCHQADYDHTNNPNHAAAGYSLECASCHQPIPGFAGASFNHPLFSLTSVHGQLQCAQCHLPGVPNSAAPTTCTGCHGPGGIVGDVYTPAKNPDHVASSLPTSCSDCHQLVPGWAGATFNHTQLALTGVHGQLQCNQCHLPGAAVTAAPTTCAGCHGPGGMVQDVYTGAKSPDHVGASFSLTCTNCHQLVPNWANATFDHTALTTFPLTGAHVAQTCDQCHNNPAMPPVGVYKGRPTTCVSCHQSDFNLTGSPPHQTGQFPTDCTGCHTTSVWQPSTFNHSTQTTFALTGAHQAVTCDQCHENPALPPVHVYKGKPTSCVSCHLSDYNGTTNPNHQTAGYSTDCASCHLQITPGWAGATFNHSQFALTTVHQVPPVTCAQCHLPGQPSTAAPTTCAGCHGPGGIVADVYTSTTAPPHAASNLSLTCTNCHTLVPGWVNASFDHTANTTFPLTASAHLAATCSQCHTTQWKGLAQTCGACHGPGGIVQDVFTPQKNPDHVAAAFANTVCTPCHKYTSATTTFAGATYDHTANTTFPLAGAHVGVQCNACHTGTLYRGLGTTCVTCHLGDYNATTAPNHSQMSPAWPTTCETCHTVTAGWPATLPGQYHNWFPITHQGARSDCTQCHNTTVYTAYTCSNHHHPASCQYLTTSTSTQARGTSSCSN